MTIVLAFARAAALAVVMAFLVPTLAAQPYMVTNLSDDVAVAGSLRNAISLANANPDLDAIMFDPALTGTITVTFPFEIKSPMMIGSMEPLVIGSSETRAITLSGGNTSRIFHIEDFSTATPHDVAIIGIRLADGWSSESGGAILSRGENLTLTDVVIENNVSGGEDDVTTPRDGGGGLWFHGGSAAQRGTLEIQNSIFRNNRSDAGDCGAIATPGGRGGAISVNGAAFVEITDSLIEGNTAKWDGGGISAWFLESTSGLLVGNSVIRNNTVCNDANGGGIFIQGGVSGDASQRDDQILIGTSTISGNSAVNGGGVYAGDYQILMVQTSTISANTATAAGGGLYLGGEGSTAMVEAVTVSGNSAQTGAIATGPFHGGALNITNATINANLGTNSAGIYASAGAVVDIRNTIVANSTTAGGTPISDLAKDPLATIALTYSNIETASAAYTDGGGNIIGSDPLLGGLADNGGPTLTHLPTPASPAIDAADPTIVGGIDQRGLPRVINGRADMGAVEAEARPMQDWLEFTLDSYAVTEGAITATIGVKRLYPSENAITVDYATTAATAGGSDFVDAGGTLQWAGGDSADKTFEITILDDSVIENPETFTVALSNATGGAIIQTFSATVEITDDDLAEVTVDDVTLPEGTGGTTDFTFTITLSQPAPYEIVVGCGVQTGTASNGIFGSDTDFTSDFLLITFPPGETTGTYTVSVNGDAFGELDETFRVVIGSVTATVADAYGEGVIQNDDAIPTISIGNFAQLEGTGLITEFLIPVALSAPPNAEITVPFTLAGGTATVGDEAWGSPDFVTFAPGQTEAFATIAVLADAFEEDDETIILTLSTPVGAATITQATSVITILNDDLEPGLNIDDVTVTEGTGGLTPLTFTVSFTPPILPPGEPFDVYWSIENVSTQSNDYTTASGVIMFMPGVTTQSIVVMVSADSKDEIDEAFRVVISSPSGIPVKDGVGAAVIVDDDDPPALNVTAATANEGDGSPSTLTFDVQLSAESAKTITVDYATADGTATAGSDYVNASGTLTFAPGQTSAQIQVATIPDASFELDETLTLVFSNPVDVTLPPSAIGGTITNDDALPQLSIAPRTLAEGSGGTTSFVHTVTLSPASGVEATVSYATGAGTATAGTDFTSASGTLSFPPGVTTQDVMVSITADALHETDETFDVILSSPANATIATGTATSTIQNDDDAPSIMIGDVSVPEGNAGAATLTFDLTLSVASETEITVAYTTADGSALAGSDYASAAGTVTFPAGTTTQTIEVNASGDVVYEADQTFTVQLSAPVNATLDTTSATGTIVNDDALPIVSITGITQGEGSGGGSTSFDFQIAITGASEEAISVDFATADGSASAPADYVARSSTLTVPGDAGNAVLTIEVTRDALDEIDEIFTLTLSNPANASLATSSASATIQDDDAEPSVSVASVSLDEGNAGTAGYTFDVALSAPSGREITIDYATSGGTATPGVDYVTSSGTLTFAPGTTSQPITVIVNGDLLHELDETFSVTLANPTNALPGILTATGTIANDDAQPALSISDVTADEGDGGFTASDFIVTLSGPSGQTVTVNYATASGTALAGDDFVSAAGTLTFLPGETSKTITIDVTGESLHEADETFTLVLSGAANATLPALPATGTIRNDDALPELAISGLTAVEGTGSTTDFTFDVTLSASSALPVSVDYTTVAGTATAGSDFAGASGVVSIPGGSTSATVTVVVTADALYEDDETFAVALSNPSNATVAIASATGIIQNDDALPALAIAAFSAPEGHAGVTPFNFDVTLSAPSGRTVTVDFTVAGATASAGTDFTLVNGTLTFAPGVTTQTVAVPVTGDALHELDETFTITLSNAANASLAVDRATGTIVNDDALASIAIADASVVEGNAGTTTLEFDVTLSAVSGRDISVSYAATPGTASSPGDYLATAGTLVIPAGSIEGSIAVTVNGDLLAESDETLLVTLTSPVNASLADATATGTIINDEGVVSLTIADIVVPEGNARGTVTFTVTLSGTSAQDVTIAYTTTDGTATAGSDYTAATGVLTIPAGATSATIDVPVDGDVLHETDESFALLLSTPAGATLGDGSASATLVNDDTMPSLHIASTSVPEGAAHATFTVHLSEPSGLTVTVQYGTSPGTATSTIDYFDQAGTVTFAPGVIAQQFTVPIVDDPLDEADETFFATLATPSNATIASGILAIGTIVDDDALPFIGIGDVSAIEGDSGTTPLTFDVVLSAPSARPVTVAFSTVEGSATAGRDFVAASGIVTFAPGIVRQQVTISVLSDRTMEPDETFSVVLSDPANATLRDAAGEGLIGDDDSPTPRLAIGSVIVRETTGPNTHAVFTLHLSKPSSETVSAFWSTWDGTATAAADYVGVTDRRITFAPGETSQTVEVEIIGDSAVELSESFIAQLTSINNAQVVGDGRATATIEDDDVAAARRRSVRTGS